MEAKPDTLFLACCRPAMFLGIPLGAYATLLFVCGEFFVLSGLAGNGISRLVVTGAIASVGYVACRIATAWDHNVFGILFLWLTTKVRTIPNAGYWHGSSVSPFPVRQARHARELVHYA